MTENFTSFLYEYFKKDVCVTSQNITFISKYTTVIQCIDKVQRWRISRKLSVFEKTVLDKSSSVLKDLFTGAINLILGR